MNLICLKFLCILLYISKVLSQEFLYIDAASTGGNGSNSNPFSNLNYAMQYISSQTQGTYTLFIRPASSPYSIQNSYPLAGFNITFQNWNFPFSSQEYLFSPSSCPNFPQVQLDGSQITATSISFIGVEFLTINNSINTLSLSANQITVSSSCLQVNFIPNQNPSISSSSNLATETFYTPPTGNEQGFLLLIQGSATIQSNLLIENIFIGGNIQNPPLLLANSLNNLQINNLTANSFPQMIADIANIEINGFFISPSIATQANTTETGPCLSKMAYYSQLNIMNLQINNIIISQDSFFVCVYQITPPQNSGISQQLFNIQNFIFNNNNITLTTDWSLIYLKLIDDSDNLNRNTSISNINISNNIAVASNQKSTDIFLFNLSISGNLQISDVTFGNNINVKLVDASPENSELYSNLGVFQNIYFTSNIWELGDNPVSNIIVNPLIASSAPAQISTFITNIALNNNIANKNIFNLEQDQTQTDNNNFMFYLEPKVSINYINVFGNQITSSSVFTIQSFNIDLDSVILNNNTFTSSNLIQSSTGSSPLQVNNITIGTTNLTYSNIIYKEFDTSGIIGDGNTDLNNSNTLIPYSVLITNFYLGDSSFIDYSTAFNIKGAPLIFIKQSTFNNLFFNSSSSLIMASDLLSALSNVVLDSQTALNTGYLNYLQVANNTNLSSTFLESIPINQNNMFDLGYAADQLTDELVFIYRVFESNFENIFLNTSNLISISTVSLNQSLVSIDSNYFVNITLSSFQDSIVRSATIRYLNFGYNELTELSGAGEILTSDQCSFLMVTNNFIHDNQGSSFLKISSDLNWGTFIQNNIVNNIMSVATFISISIDSNSGQVLFQNNSFNNCFLEPDPSVYKQINFIALDNGMTNGNVNNLPDFYFGECNFSNIILYKNHPLIKQYQNSFLVANLAEDTLLIQNSKFDNISIRYAHNLLVAITDTVQINSTTFSNIENFDAHGSIYILATSTIINNSLFLNNSTPVGNGGAIYIDYDSVVGAQTDITIINSVFQNNAAVDGSIIYYSTKAINFTANNNIFIDNTISANMGSFIYFFNATFLGFTFNQNTFICTKPISNYIAFFEIDTSNSQEVLSLSNTIVNIEGSFSGTLFSVQNSDITFEITGLNVANTSSSLTPGASDEFSIMTLGSGNIILQNANIFNISSNVRSLIDIVCEQDINTSLQIEDSVFSSLLLTHDTQSLLYSQDYAFAGVVHLSNRGGKLTCNNTLSIINTNFLNFSSNSTSSNASVIMSDYNGQFSLLIEGSTFQNLYSFIGSGVHLASTSSIVNNVTISNNQFGNTTSIYEGGAIYNNKENLTILSNQFSNCRSLQRNGAVIYSMNVLDFSVMLQSNIFINPIRYYAFSFSDSNPIGTEPALLNLTFSTPDYIYQNITNGTLLLSNFSGYDLKNINISAVLIDYLNQIVYDTSSTENNQKTLSLEIGGKSTESRDCDEAQCNITEPILPIKGNATEIVQGQIHYSSPEVQISSSLFNIMLRACVNGELDAFVTNNFNGPQCSPCPPGTYALNVKTDTKCNACPDFAICLGGNSIIVQQGYWRPNTSTILIQACRTADVCLGGFESNCEEGHAGLLCDSCDINKRWVEDQGVCTLCPSTEKNLFVFICVFLLTLGYQLWYIKATRISNSFFIAYSGNTFDTEIGRKIELKITQGMYIRLLTTYSQIFAIIITFNVEFMNIFGNFEEITETLANPSIALFYSSSCALLDFGISDNGILNYKIAFVVLSPIIKTLVLFVFRLFYWRFKINEKRLSILIITAVCLFILEQPSIAQQLFKYLSCVQVGVTNSYYLQNDLEYECYTSEYYMFRNLVVIPSLVLYIGIIPGLIIYILLKNRKDINNIKLRMNLGAIFNEYRPKAYFWGIVLMATKLIIIFIGSNLNSDTKTQSLSIFIVIYIYYTSFLKVQPYERKDLYNSERIALINYLLTVFGSTYYKNNSLSYMQWLTLVILTMLNIYIISLFMWQIFKMYVLEARDIIMPILDKFRKPKQVDINFSDDSEMVDFSLDKIEERIFKERNENSKSSQKEDEQNSQTKPMQGPNDNQV